MNATVIGCRRIKLLPTLLLLLMLTGCIAGQESFKRGQKAMEDKSYDEAVMEFMTAVDQNPDIPRYRLNLNRAKNQAAMEHKLKADRYFNQEDYRQAVQEYMLAAELDESLFTAVDGLKKSRHRLQAKRLTDEARILVENNRYSQARDTLARALYYVSDYQPALDLKSQIKQDQFALVDGVQLEVTSTDPINLNFHNTRITDVFDILTKLSGINFILDEDVRDDRTTLFLEQATFAQALELLLRMNKLDKKILNGKTIILYPKTRDKQKQFEDQIIQTFYLSHIDAKKAVNLLRTMLQVRKIYVQEELNAIVIRDQPDVIKLAQKMIEANDRGNSEVVFDLELLEVNHSDTRELGLKMSNYSIGAGLGIENTGLIADSGVSAGGPTVNLIEPGDNLDPFFSIPTASFRFLKTLVSAEVLANPKIRVRNKEKANVHVGSREPVITVTINDTQTSENVQYIDVGVKLDIEPTVQLDHTIVTKLGLEVSNVSGRERTSNGTAVITISSTNATTTLTLKDGEQTIIGGLIRDDNSVTKNKIPLFGDVPLLGEVFNGTDKSKIKREILLSITPHIVKFVPVPQGELASIWSGGEDDLKYGRNFGTFVEEYQSASNGGDLQLEEPDPISEDATQNEDVSVQTDPIREQLVASAQPSGQTMTPRLFVTGAQLASVGDELVYSVRVDDVRDLVRTSAQIAYDPDRFEFVSAVKGPLLSQNDQDFLLVVTPLPGERQVLVGSAAQNADAAISGSGEIYRLTFRAIASGSAELTPTEIMLRDIKGASASVESQGLSIDIGD